MTTVAFAERLLQARRTGLPAEWDDVHVRDRAAAYAIQDLVVSQLGPVGGWKVGAAARGAEPISAPCPAADIFEAGSVFVGPEWCLRGVEVEVGLRLGRDLGARSSRSDCVRAVEALLPIVEVVETRLGDWANAPPLAKLADFQSHGALVLGPPSTMDPATLDLADMEAELAFDGDTVAMTRGGNPAADAWHLLAWLAGQAEARGKPMRAGDIVTTGSCTGLLFAPPGAKIHAQLHRLGGIVLQF